MKVSREQMAENRQRIITEAARLFREQGVDAVSVAQVMKAAGLTHGGFYGHFKSKADLVCQAVEQMVAHEEPLPSFAAFAESYLSADHWDNAGEGCPTAALSLEFRHQSPEARCALTKAIEAQLARIAQTLGKEAGQDLSGEELRRQAIGKWSAMVGALIMARAVSDTELSEEILTSTREFLTHADD